VTHQQFYPSPGDDPGWRWDHEGRAEFRHEGFDVRVRIRPVTADQPAYYMGDEPSPHDVVVVGTVTLDGIEVSNAEESADITDAHRMREALENVLDNTVKDARTQVGRLVKALAAVDTRAVKDAEKAERDAPRWPAKGTTVRVYDKPSTPRQGESWGARRPPSLAGEVIETPADGGTFLTIDVGGEYGGVTYTVRDFPTRQTWVMLPPAPPTV
jgi:hypothetical protein